MRVISEEQNFITQFFHLNSLSSDEFPDIVSTNLLKTVSVPISRRNNLTTLIVT